ncbi:hypothetical protein J5Y04_10805 [Kitasatospora sp. RG8]|uniref:hypothetical protein n=1 Tax=Kitasatospora sp. RG8 TaxID=2820815 RepID=UPI001AE039C3|nr:hypothetical protein [Kitasatospora sp. RG8]MBP0450035.1 hypothetical protein [Kitasatospora sp. RG8]
MALREDTEQGVHHERDRQREQYGRRGRHGRPKPFGGRLRLPTLRFSGAAMAMSTVVGISIATTCLLNEQQGVGRRAGVARVGSTPPPSPDATTRADAAANSSPAPVEPRPADRSAGRSTEAPWARATASHPPASGVPAPRPASPDTPAPDAAAPFTGPVPAPSAARTGPAEQPGGPSQGGDGAVTAAGSAAQATATPPTAGRPADQQPPTPRPLAPAEPGTPVAPTAPTGPAGPTETGTAPTGPTGPTDDDAADQALTGTALVQPLGRDGTHHLLTLTVTEPLTALQAEFRLAAGELAPGTAWTDLSGAVVTTHQERGTLVYRFTTPSGTDVRPGRYTFGVRGMRPAPTPPGPTAGPTAGPTVGPTAGPARPTGPTGATRKPAPAESWNAAAFGIDRPRAVAALGTFTHADGGTTDGSTGTAGRAGTGTAAR